MDPDPGLKVRIGEKTMTHPDLKYCLEQPCKLPTGAGPAGACTG